MPKRDSNAVNRRAKAWNAAESTFAAHAAARHVPLGGTFELTARCNLKCKMCYIRTERSQFAPGQRELTAREWIALGEEAAKAGTLHLLLTGGEPMLRPDFPEIYTALAHMGFIILLYTNATLITPEILRLLKRCPPTATGVTLYGASRETYERICGNPDAFDQTLRGLDMLSEVPTSLEVRTTFIRDNMHELSEVRAIAGRYTNRFSINYEVFKAIRGGVARVEDCRMTPSEMYDLAAENHRHYEELDRLAEAALKEESPIDHSEKPREYGFEIAPALLRCLAAKSMYWITWDGKMLACGSFSSPYTLPLEEGFLPAWNRLPGLFEGMREPEECGKCEYRKAGCPNCPATLQAESGSAEKIAPYPCLIAQERYKRKKNGTWR